MFPSDTMLCSWDFFIYIECEVKQMKYITLEELKEKEKQLIEEYNENVAKKWNVFAEHSLKCLEAVRYVIKLIENKGERQ